MIQRPLRFFAILLSTLFIAHCGSLKDIRQLTVDGRRVEYATGGTGNTTIVFETGMGPTIKTWRPIYDSLARYARVYAYNRPGYGRSNIRRAPRRVREVARQLHVNLRAAEQRPPYILVGHSVGGLYVNMFARLYPEEVAAVVFLDASHPDQFEYFREHQPLLYSLLMTSTTKGKRRYENDIVKNTQDDFIDLPPFPAIPVLVLTAGRKSSPLEGDKMRRQWLLFQEDLARLSTNSKHLIVEGSGHYVHKDRPDVVIEEMKRLLKN